MVEYRRGKHHGCFDGEEMEEDVDSVCLVRTISRQINPQVMRFVKKGWQNAFSEELKDI